MTLIISPLAYRRLREIQVHIALDGNLSAALQVVLRIRQAAEMLTDFPELAPPWQRGPTRAPVVSGLPYRIHYRIHADAVEIITVVHTRQRPTRFS
jgi:plasmid stabilization system protein ParE